MIKKIIYKFIILLQFINICSLKAADNLVIQGSLDQFANENVIVLYRGIHYSPNIFNEAQRQTYIDTSHVNQNMYSAASYELADVNFLNATRDDSEMLIEKSKRIINTIHNLNQEIDYIINGSTYFSKRFFIQELYSNSEKNFYNLLRNTERRMDFNLNFTRNPFLSFSDEVDHPAKYGFGLKRFSGRQHLKPEYDNQGIPKNPILGKLFGIILDEAAIEELDPFNAFEAHQKTLIKLSKHHAKNVFNEREISIPGYVPSDYVVFEKNLSLPSLNGPYNEELHGKEYGFSETRYNNFKEIITNENITQEEEDNELNKKIEKIIKGAETNDLMHNNTLHYAVPKLFDDELSRIEARNCKMVLQQEGTDLKFVLERRAN